MTSWCTKFHLTTESDATRILRRLIIMIQAIRASSVHALIAQVDDVLVHDPLRKRSGRPRLWGAAPSNDDDTGNIRVSSSVHALIAQVDDKLAHIRKKFRSCNLPSTQYAKVQCLLKVV